MLTQVWSLFREGRVQSCIEYKLELYIKVGEWEMEFFFSSLLRRVSVLMCGVLVGDGTNKNYTIIINQLP